MLINKIDITSSLQGAAPVGTLPTPWNAGFIGIGWITEDFTKSEVQQRQRTIVIDIQKVPLQGFLQCSRRVCYDDCFATLRITDQFHRNGPSIFRLKGQIVVAEISFALQFEKGGVRCFN
jgi:hypothetical protein